MNEEMYTTPGIHYSYPAGFDTLARSRKNQYIWQTHQTLQSVKRH